MRLMVVAIVAFLIGCGFSAICYGVLSADVMDAEWREIAEQSRAERAERSEG